MIVADFIWVISSGNQTWLTGKSLLNGHLNGTIIEDHRSKFGIFNCQVCLAEGVGCKWGN